MVAVFVYIFIYLFRYILPPYRYHVRVSRFSSTDVVTSCICACLSFSYFFVLYLYHFICFLSFRPLSLSFSFYLYTSSISFSSIAISSFSPLFLYLYTFFVMSTLFSVIISTFSVYLHQLSFPLVSPFLPPFFFVSFYWPLATFLITVMLYTYIPQISVVPHTIF